MERTSVFLTAQHVPAVPDRLRPVLPHVVHAHEHAQVEVAENWHHLVAVVTPSAKESSPRYDNPFSDRVGQ